MPPRVSWSNLLPGLVAFVAVVAIALAVLLFAGIGKIRGKTMSLFVATDKAAGVMRGTEVWVAGQKVGRVDGVAFRAPGPDTAGRVIIAITVRARDAAQIRRDSPVQVRPGMNFIAPPVVYLATGSPTSPAVHDGDTLRARAQSDLEVAGVKFKDATDQLGPIMTDARTVIARIHDPRGTVGAVLTEGFGGEVTRLRRRFNGFRARAANGNSDEGGDEEGDAVHGHASAATVMASARTTLARVDSIRALLGSSTNSFGRFRRDSSLGATVANVRDELTQLRESLATTEGTIRRTSTDSALVRSIADARREMALLFADIRRRPLRYISF